LHAEHPRQDRVVSNLGVHVEWDVCGVDGHPVLHQRANAATAAAGDGLETGPEQTVVHQQEVCSPAAGFVDRRLARIHRRRHVAHGSGVLDLEAVQGVGIVLDLTDLEVAVEVRAELREVHGVGVRAVRAVCRQYRRAATCHLP
jgi:hypothetical protein